MYVFINCISPRISGNDCTLPPRTAGSYLHAFTTYHKARAVRRMQTNTCTKALRASSCNSELPPTPKLIQPCPKVSNCPHTLSKPCPKAPINPKTCQSLTHCPQHSQRPPNNPQALSENCHQPSLTPDPAPGPAPAGDKQDSRGQPGTQGTPKGLCHTEGRAWGHLSVPLSPAPTAPCHPVPQQPFGERFRAGHGKAHGLLPAKVSCRSSAAARATLLPPLASPRVLHVPGTRTWARHPPLVTGCPLWNIL